MDAEVSTDAGLRRVDNGDGDPERPEAASAGEGPSRTSLEQLQQITDASLGFMSLEQMLAEVLDRVRAALGSDTAAVLLLDEDRGVLLARAARGLEEEVRQGVQVPLARGFAGRVAAQAEPITIEDLSHADVVNPILRQKGIRSMLGVPLLAEGRVIGVMHVGTLERRHFGEQDVALLQLAAERVAVALDGARLAEQRAVTEIMQRTLLPSALPEIPGLRFSAKYLPAGSGVKVGGDWYDVVHLASGRIAFVIGDVVGRGVLAASVMAEIRTAVRAYLIEDRGLPQVMALLNELLISMGGNRSATAAILELDLERGELEAVSAAHLPPVLLGPDGGARLLQPPQGYLLGIRSGVEYDVQLCPFPEGSTLLLYSDGLVERRGEPLDEGLRRLLAAAELAREPDNSSFADRVYRALVDETSVEDDVALLAIESLPLGAELDLDLPASPDVLALLRRTIARWLNRAGLPAAEVFDVTLAASEAAANAIEHAYGARDATFSVACRRVGEEVTVVVRDRGRWRTEQPFGRGRGLPIMRALVDSIDVQRNPGGTVVTLVKRVGGSR